MSDVYQMWGKTLMLLVGQRVETGNSGTRGRDASTAFLLGGAMSAKTRWTRVMSKVGLMNLRNLNSRTRYRVGIAARCGANNRPTESLRHVLDLMTATDKEYAAFAANALEAGPTYIIA